MTRLVLVRHGESQVTLDRIIGGRRSCRGLSVHGRRQAESLRDRWTASPEFRPDVVIASDFARARETAEIVAATWSSPPIEIDPGFGEHDPGPECDGLPYSEFEARFGNPDWDHDPWSVTFPGGETIAEFHLRVGSAVRALVERHADRVAVVFCHAGVVDAVLRQSLRTFATGGFEILTANTSITEVELVRTGRWRLIRYNDAAHLVGLAP